MKAFISYSINNTQKYILSLLSMNLNERGVKVVSSYSNPVGSINFSANQIRGCQFFIGIICHRGGNGKKVLDEWKIARGSRVPNILLIEDRVRLTSQGVNAEGPNIIRFNRNNADAAIEIVNSKINRATKKVVEHKEDNNTTAWMLSGAALILLLGALSSNNDK